MKMILGRVIQQFAILTLLAIILAGCSPKSPVVPSSDPSRVQDSGPSRPQGSSPSRPHKSIAQRGAEMQRTGIMSQKDYIRVVNLQHIISHTHRISDEDFAWTLSLLKTSRAPIARARAMAVLSYIHPMSSAQKAQTTSAIAPYLNGGNPLDLAYAISVRKSIQRN